MSCKKIGIVLFSVLFIVVSSLCSFNFATVANDDAVQEGVYYIKNYDYELYMNNLDDLSITMSSYAPNSQQRWELISLSNGYYAIKNSSSGKYLSAPTDNNEGSLITQETVQDESYTDRHKWSITPAYLGATSYIIQAKSQEADGLILTCSSDMGIYGYDLIQGYYTQYGYYEEWLLEEFQDVNLIGIASDGDHTTALVNAYNDFLVSGANPNYLTPVSISTLLLRGYLESSDIIIICALGGYDTTGTYVYTNAEVTTWFHSGNIYNYSGNTGIDMSDCEVAVFAGCYTANHETQSLPQAAVDAGSDMGIGFTKAIAASETNVWVEKFSLLNSTGTASDEAAYSASIFAGSTPTLNSVVVKYNNSTDS